MQTTENETTADPRPSIMHIMRGVASAAGVNTADLMGSVRRTTLTQARAAVYLIATENGYTRDEIMYYIDRDRTVGYNYDANLRGYLRHNDRFLTLCRISRREIGNHPSRATKPRQGPRMAPQEGKKKSGSTATDAKAGQEADSAPQAWRGQLGWSFTAEEMADIDRAILDARAWFRRTYGRRPPRPKRPEPRLKAHWGEELTTAEAIDYLEVSPKTLACAVARGDLSRHQRPGDRNYYYRRADLDRFAEQRSRRNQDAQQDTNDK